MQAALLRFIQSLLTQVAVTSVCNRHHDAEAQFCRWLLMVFDRIPGKEIRITESAIASTLGLSRERISRTLSGLVMTGLVSHGYGHITLLDRAGLEAHSCECYRSITEEINRLVTR